MCGIFFTSKIKKGINTKSLSNKMSHRGPDESGIHITDEGYGLFHERLSIMDTQSGKQPILGRKNCYVIHNGEIYNHKKLQATHFPGLKFRTNSDSEIIVHLYEKYGKDFCSMLDGVFAFAVTGNQTFMVARDPIGVKPLYWGKSSDDTLYFASEVKSLINVCDEYHTFPPGHYFTPEEGFTQYFKPQWAKLSTPELQADSTLIKEKLINSVKKRLMSDVPLGVLLSGGLDSSLVASIASREMRKKGKKLHSFSIGLKGSPDLKAAKLTASFIGTQHHEIIFTPKQGINAIRKVIYHLESYDVTTIRASTPMYLLSQEIVKTGIKSVLSGEGADEIFGGYLYFENAPSLQDFRSETISRVLRLSKADCLRADKSTMASGLEARVPFLDLDFLGYSMQVSARDKKQAYQLGKPEKHILRTAFDSIEDPYLPQEILWRQKEQFSDGVGYSWIDQLVTFCSKQVSDKEMEMASKLFPHNTPLTKEAYYFRKIFTEYYPEQLAAEMIEMWVPKWQKNADPSGRANSSHQKAYVKNLTQSA